MLFEQFSGKFCLNFFDPNSERFAKFFDPNSERFAILFAHFRLCMLSKRFKIMEKLHTSKTFSKLAGGRMHTPHPNPLDPPVVISYRNHQKSLVYFIHLIGTIGFVLFY